MNQIAEKVRQEVELVRDELISVSHEIHDHPEVRFEEQRASDLLSELLEKHGFSVEKGVAGMPTAFRADFRLGTGGPKLAVFSEYDALPGIGHACGHNIIASAGVGAAIVAAKVLGAMPDINATIVCFGSPGEEGGGGKVLLINAGELNGVDTAIMIHPAGEDAIYKPNLGRLSLEVEFSGRASHAASAPDQGLNALDASTLFLVAIGLLRQQLRSNSRVHAIVLEGGDAVNVIPERSRVRIFVRSPDPIYLEERLRNAVTDCANGAALATGCTAEIYETAPAYQPVNSNPVITELCYQAFLSFGRTPLSPQEVVPAGETAGSTDMGNVSRVLPAIHPYIEIAPYVAGHTREFEKAAADEGGDEAVVDGASILAFVLISQAQDPMLVKKAKQEFRP